MFGLRTVLCLTLATVLTLTSLGVGHARGQAQAVDAIVLCTGHGTSVVFVDIDGQPVEREILCPDWALGLLAPGASGPETAPRDLSFGLIDRLSHGPRVMGGRRHLRPAARAPPPAA